MTEATELPIHRVRSAFLEALGRAPVVLSSPTGSGKSTEVPRWCPGRTLVVEPRRIACRSLAARVADLEGTALGRGVGFFVRDARVMDDETRIVFATPGIALRARELLETADTIVLDEFHERSLETDLLLALLVRARRETARPPALVVMSATLEGERVAAHVGGVHLAAEGVAFPVEVRHLAGASVLPDREELPSRVLRAIDASAVEPGDVLVFLPGKAEIAACEELLRASRHAASSTIVPLHGDLDLDAQRRAFAPSSRRKLILATNVAETSLTIPGVGIVIDSGLVRRTRYHDGRGFLTLVPIAADSAAQRTGRAGRTGPGVSYRLWSAAAKLEPLTPPEIHRESLVPLVLAASAFGVRVEELPLLDAPRPYALASARAELEAWRALEGDRALSERGVRLFTLPVAPLLAALLTSARAHDCLEDMIDLVAALSLSRPLFLAPIEDERDDRKRTGCDATALVRALRSERADDQALSRAALDEARATRARLRRAEGLDGRGPPTGSPFARDAIVRAALGADARLAHVARRRGRDTFFSNGGTELVLARESAVEHARDVEAIVVLDTRALGAGQSTRVIVTAAMPVPLARLAQHELGDDRLAAVRLEGGRVIATIERVVANRVIAQREEVPHGAMAEQALVTLLLRGSLFRDAIETTRRRLARTALAAALGARGHPLGLVTATPVPSLEDWLATRVATLGVTSGDDLPMLAASDFVSEALPYEIETGLARELPEEISVGDATYRAEYDLAKSEVWLVLVRGHRKDPPPLSYLPKLAGLSIGVRGPKGAVRLR
ncbi:MAG: helicase-related protein [Sandaracinus sp.]